MQTCRQVSFAVSADHKEKIKENEKKQEFGPCQGTKKTVEHKGDSDPNCYCCAWNGHPRLGKGAGSVGKRRMSQNHPN